MAKHVGSLQIDKDLRVKGRVTSALDVQDKVKAAGFYLAEGANSVGFDLSQASIEIHLPSPNPGTPYFLSNFSDYEYIVSDVILACQMGTAVFGFYILPANRVMPRGIGIVGTGPHGNTLAEFYVAAAIRRVDAMSNNVVRHGESLSMVCLETEGVANVRGRVKVRLSG